MDSEGRSALVYCQLQWGKQGTEKYSKSIPICLPTLGRYTRGAWLMPHVDRMETHVISAIINIDQKVDTEWPLQIQDHQGRMHELVMKPGEMVLYER